MCSSKASSMHSRLQPRPNAAFLVPTMLRTSSLAPRFTHATKHLRPCHTPVRRQSTSTAPRMAAQLPEKPTVGFIGLGVMGLPMLQNLSQEFSNLVVWNRTPKQPELPSSSANMQIASSPAEVIAASDITFSMLSTPAAVEAVFHETPALTALQPGKALVDCSTLQISDMQKTAGAVADRGATFLEAPVSGSKVPAELGQLIFLCAGDKPLFDDPVLQKAFSLMGKKAVFLGEVGNGTKMKLVVNQLMCTMMASFSESIVLAEALDLSVPDLIEVLSLGTMNNPMFALKGPKMADGEKKYATNFPLEHAQKDVRFAQALASEKGIDVTTSSAAHEWYKAAVKMGLGRDDFCAVIESMRAGTSSN